MKVIWAGVLILLVVVFLVFMVAAIPDGVTAFKTDVIDKAYTVTTGVGATSANVSLPKGLFEGTTDNVLDVSSDALSDSPVAASYASANKALLITGLTAETTRTITVSFRTDGLTEYAMAGEAANYLPALVVALLIAIPLAGIVAILVAGRR